MTAQIKNIIFDMDGTLVNTALFTIPACLRTADLFGLPPREPHEIAGAIGYGGLSFHQKLYPEYDDECLTRFGDEMEKRENALMEEIGSGILFDGVEELLQTLNQQDCTLHIASTGSESHVLTALSSAGIISCFQNICFGEPDKTPMVSAIIQTLRDVRDGGWLILGDRQSDYMAGRNNGMITVAARYGFGSCQEYERFAYGIDSPLELLCLPFFQKQL